MLRRDPSTIKLTPEDLKDLQMVFMQDSNSLLSVNDSELDNQNMDSSMDESYLVSKSRERTIKDRIFGTGTPPNNNNYNAPGSSSH
ncbi:hypothetical protein DAMA08_033420 [Martiniozyma asiatica (nom. inval.)]|nr:hypothetical protein DAMA08_033420 [Martiniozyma asiatica]